MAHNLYTPWALYMHMPFDTNWDIDSYKQICTINTIEEIISILQVTNKLLYERCMFFIMRKNIKPLWEMPENVNGGSFSYKISNNELDIAWKNLSYKLLGETLLSNTSKINGISLSPKKNFAIIKIWMSDCSVTDPNYIQKCELFNASECLFKKHMEL
jgi:hypothetical protein